MAKGSSTKTTPTKIPPTKIPPSQPATDPNLRQWKIEKIVMPIIVGVLGCMTVVVGAILSGPVIEIVLKAFSPTPTMNALVPMPQITPFANPVGDKIYFLRDSNYYMMTLDDRSENLIANFPASLVLCPSISPDGEKVLFNSNFESFVDLYIIDRDGNNVKDVTNSRGFDEVCGSWSPDQKQVLFYLQYSDDNNDLFVINSDGSNEFQITHSYSNSIGAKNMISEMAWAPDGNSIVFSSNQDGDLEIYIYEFSTQKITQVTSNIIDDYRASWSPDGTRIVYTSRIQGDNTEVFVINLTNVILPTVGVNVTNNPEHDTDATWSPDSKSIAFVSSRGGNDDIYIMDADGNNLWKLTNSPEDETRPRWIR